MIIRPNDIEIPPGNVYLNDKLGRDVFVNKIISIIKLSKTGAVVAVDGKWGVGKSVVARLLNAKILAEGGCSIYYDAFVNDYIDDSVISILCAINRKLRPEGEQSTINQTGLMEASKAVCKNLVKIGTGTAVRILSGGLISADEILGTEAGKELSNKLGDSVEQLIDERIKSCNEAEASIERFKNKLQEIASGIKEETKLPFIVIIDELDRCRPNFAVSMIESIKHLFSVSNVVFVLFYNQSQITASIKGLYGQNIDSEDYLHKFIDIRLSLPSTRGVRADYLEQYARNLSQKFAVPDRNISSLLEETYVNWAKYYNYSLREIERSYICACLMLSTYKGLSIVNHPEIVSLVAFFKVKNNELLNNIRVGNFKSDDISGFLTSLRAEQYNRDQSENSELTVRLTGFINLIKCQERSEPFDKDFIRFYSEITGYDYKGYLSKVCILFNE
jgi:hypothetical protein